MPKKPITTDTDDSYMRQVETLAGEYRLARDRLGTCLQTVQDEIDRITRLALHDLRAYARAAAQIHGELGELITSRPEAWDKPRTRQHSGIKAGLRRVAPKLVIPSPDATVEAIRELHPEESAALIRTKDSPIVSALSDWSEEDLAAIHVHITPAQDELVIKDAFSDLEKNLQKLFGDALEDQTNG